MKCPTCDAQLMMAERKGIEIDFCPECRGVWLDKGELDKIIELTMQEVAPTQAAVSPSAPPQPEAYPPGSTMGPMGAGEQKVPLQNVRPPTSQPPQRQTPPPRPRQREERRDDEYYERKRYKEREYGEGYRDDKYYYKKKKKKGVLGEIFDIFD